MKQYNVAVVVGTRPEAIKLAPVIKSLQNSELNPVVISTGQHKEMLEQVFSLFDIKADINLDLMRPNQTLGSLSARALSQLDIKFNENKPDYVLVQGDTTTAFIGSLAAFYHKIPTGHVEAGLRTHNIYSPYPEEGNRSLISKIATHHFPPTNVSKKNLEVENISQENILVTGNTVIDSLLNIVNGQQIKNAKIEGYQPSERPYVLVTGHRRENFGEGFINICSALKSLADKYKNYDFVYPVHLNPNVQKPVNELLGTIENIKLIKPASYLSFIKLLKNCKLILTDSGGVQEEAPSLGKPVLVMRSNTERPEGVDAGTVRLVGTEINSIVENVSTLLDDKQAFDSMAESHNPYGDGKASERIVNYIAEYLQK